MLAKEVLIERGGKQCSHDRGCAVALHDPLLHCAEDNLGYRYKPARSHPASNAPVRRLGSAFKSRLSAPLGETARIPPPSTTMSVTDEAPPHQPLIPAVDRE